jgi:hypothetical protein
VTVRLGSQHVVEAARQIAFMHKALRVPGTTEEKRGRRTVTFQYLDPIFNRAKAGNNLNRILFQGLYLQGRVLRRWGRATWPKDRIVRALPRHGLKLKALERVRMKGDIEGI